MNSAVKGAVPISYCLKSEASIYASLSTTFNLLQSDADQEIKT